MYLPSFQFAIKQSRRFEELFQSLHAEGVTTASFDNATKHTKVVHGHLVQAPQPNNCFMFAVPPTKAFPNLHLPKVLITTYDGAKSEELLPYHFCALRPCIPFCLYGINAATERQAVDPHFGNNKAVGTNWQVLLRFPFPTLLMTP